MIGSRTALPEWFALSALLIGVTLFLVRSDWLWRVDQLIYDAHLKAWSRPAPDDVVIVAIDEASLSALGRWPWSRRVHAELIDRLTAEGARAIALDIIFAEEDVGDPGSDEALARSLRDSGRSVLPVLVEQPTLGGQLIETLPIPVLASATTRLGHVHVELDLDGIARRVYLLEGRGEAYWPSLTLAMLQFVEPGRWDDLPGMRNPEKADDVPQLSVRDHQILVPFAGAPGHFAHISYAQALNGEYLEGTFADKFVLVGVTATGHGDGLPTPVSGHNQPMPGVELHANILDTLRRGMAVQVLNSPWRMVLSALLAFLPMLLYPRLSPRSSLLVAMLLVVLVLLMSAALLRVEKLWFPPAPALFALTISYPLWSWRRLESTMRYLDGELARLQAEHSALPITGSSHFSPAMEFLSGLLPVRGWTLRDFKGQVIANWGQPVLAPPGAIPVGSWLENGQQLWTRVTGRAEEWSMGVVWNSPNPPNEVEGQLLSEVAYQFTTHAAGTAREPVRGVEIIDSRIEQVQNATKHMRAMRSFVASSMEKMADGVLVVSSLGQVLLANRQAARYLCSDPSIDVTGKPLLGLLNDLSIHDSTSWEEALRQALLELRTVQLNIHHKNGFDLLVQMTPFVRGDEHPGDIIVNFSDVSALTASERRRSEVLEFLSHDLRSPLVSVLALLELAKEKRSEEDTSGLLQRMRSYTEKTLSLADQFLHLARVESSEDVTFHEVELVSVATGAFEESWAQAKSKQIDLNRQFDVDEAWVHGDGELLERAITNLLGNAIRYSPPKSEVLLTVARSGKEFRCCVIDNGYGIAGEELPKLFDRFQRFDRENERKVRSTGLGLALVKAAADLHGGRVEVESKEGKGSRFCLVLNANAS